MVKTMTAIKNKNQVAHSAFNRLRERVKKAHTESEIVIAFSDPESPFLYHDKEKFVKEMLLQVDSLKNNLEEILN